MCVPLQMDMLPWGQLIAPRPWCWQCRPCLAQRHSSPLPFYGKYISVLDYTSVLWWRLIILLTLWHWSFLSITLMKIHPSVVSWTPLNFNDILKYPRQESIHCSDIWKWFILALVHGGLLHDLDANPPIYPLALRQSYPKIGNMKYSWFSFSLWRRKNSGKAWREASCWTALVQIQEFTTCPTPIVFYNWKLSIIVFLLLYIEMSEKSVPEAWSLRCHELG